MLAASEHASVDPRRPEDHQQREPFEDDADEPADVAVAREGEGDDHGDQQAEGEQVAVVQPVALDVDQTALLRGPLRPCRRCRSPLTEPILPSQPRQWRHGRPPRDRQHPRRARARTSSSTREGRVIYVGKAKSLRSRLSNYFAPPARCCRAHPPDGAGRRDASSGSSPSNEVEAFFLEFNLIKQHKPRFNIRLKDDKSYPYLAVTLDEEWPRAMVLRGPEAQGRPLLRAVRARVRDPRDARPAAAHVPDPHVHEGQVRPAPPARPPVPLRAHREVRGAVRRRHRPRRVRRARRRSCSTSSTASTTRSLKRLEQRMQRRGRRSSSSSSRPGVRDQLASVRKAIERQQMVGATRGGLRPHRHRRGRARGERAGLLRAQGPGRRAQGPDRRQGRRRRDARARRPHRRAALRRRAPRRRPARRSSSRSSPRTASSTRSSSRCNRGSKVRIRVPQRGGKRELLRDRDAQRARRRSRGTSCERASDHNARARALRRAAGGARPARGAAADRVLRHLEPAGHRDRRLDGRDGGRPAEAVRLPPVQGARRSTARTTSRRWRRC